ncbi:testis-expressed protein 43-like [Mugil cephalus]|uniref:testis-expressed protein 43-like n=1 Tax=Mugil cephalus TaxID=48193 RepID=UPI001FB62342|nr:testis-expressed protein 43-like [Mugil cephalus]XP_047448969.1 testis-expressed protein 43-like [Mugil cephalus]
MMHWGEGFYGDSDSQQTWPTLQGALSHMTGHPMIPKLYVMPWKQDMKNQRLLMKNAALAGIPVLPLEESLCFCGRERLCHSQHSTQTSSSSSSSSWAPLRCSSFRYNSSVVTTRRLYRT